jgi:hypothetical protein
MHLRRHGQLDPARDRLGALMNWAWDAALERARELTATLED